MRYYMVGQTTTHHCLLFFTPFWSGLHSGQYLHTDIHMNNSVKYGCQRWGKHCLEKNFKMPSLITFLISSKDFNVQVLASHLVRLFLPFSFWFRCQPYTLEVKPFYRTLLGTANSVVTITTIITLTSSLSHPIISPNDTCNHNNSLITTDL